MPRTKKIASPKVFVPKKAPVKKVVPKSTPSKKVVAEPVVPVKWFTPVQMYLHTNSGEANLTFSDEAAFKAAVLCIESAPRKSTGGRSVPTYTVTSDQGPLSFQTLKKYEIKS